MTLLASDKASPASDVVKAITTDPHHPTAAQESTYFIASLLMECTHWVLKLIGQDHNSTLYMWVYVILVFLFAWFVGTLLKWIIVFILRHLTPHMKSGIYANLLKRRFFTKTAKIIPPIIFLILIQFTLYSHPHIASWLNRLTICYIIVVCAISLSTLADVIWDHINSRENTRHLPLRGVVQVLKLIVWIFAIVSIAAVMMEKSPGTLLAGLGAFAAVLMLIFKDSILGIVAGVQLSENDSLHVGDWISLPSGQANGTVMSVSLTDVKILNWDMTTSTVPPYTLITGGFKNYRTMQESHTRRIQRCVYIDGDSIVPTTPEMLQEFSELPFMKEWIAAKLQQQQEGHVQNVNNTDGLADGTIETNLGAFRAYLTMYLAHNPDVAKDSTFFVTTLEQTPTGVPLQIYCFTATSSWLPYEGIQAAIFEHVEAMLHKFKLYLFENPSGRDTLIDGYLSPGKDPERVFGIPYPFFQRSGTPDNPGIPPAGLYPNAPSSPTSPTPPTKA